MNRSGGDYNSYSWKSDDSMNETSGCVPVHSVNTSSITNRQLSYTTYSHTSLM